MTRPGLGAALVALPLAVSVACIDVDVDPSANAGRPPTAPSVDSDPDAGAAQDTRDGSTPARPDEDDGAPDGGDPDLDSGGEDANIPPARVLASEPAEGALTYAFEMLFAGAWVRRKVVRLEFDTVMDTTVTTLSLISPDGMSHAFHGTWSPDGRVLEGETPKNVAGSRPLAYQTHYSVDLSALRDPQGRGIDLSHAYLGDGKVDFTTLPQDALLEHTCTHTNDASQLLGLSSTPGAGLPIGTPHVRYAMILPDGAGPRTGHASWQVFGAATYQRYVVFLRDDVPLKLTGPGGAAPPVPPAPYPVWSVCALVKGWSMVLEKDVAYDLELGPTATTPIEIYFEATTL